ncbi:MAG TPA: hypothetical protein VLB86_08540 [Gaiellaceae bacterium]|nr:hypothetical protein [Gaiellaceae bacterium]
MRWIRAYRERKALAEVARLLAAVDAPRRERAFVRRVHRVSLGARA